MQISDIDEGKLAPVMKQWLHLKKQYPGHIMFFRIGDFYEMFFDDAVNASRTLDLTLTGRDCGLSGRAPMCGVPYHAYESYVKRLLDAQYSVAICEQFTAPGESTIVKRDIVRIVTPGTLVESGLLDDAANNYICSVFCKDEKIEETGLCFCDISTGELLLTYKDNIFDIINEISRYQPTEIIINAHALSHKSLTDFLKLKLKRPVNLRDDLCFDIEEQYQNCISQFGENAIEFESLESGVLKQALCGVAEYIFETHRSATSHFSMITLLDGEGTMSLDYNAMRNLEIVETLRSGKKKGSLLSIIDSTKTSMGRRALHNLLLSPLTSPARIMERLDAVEMLKNNMVTRADISDILRRISDIQRLINRVVYKKATPRDLRSLYETASLMPEFKALAGSLGQSKLLAKINKNLSPLTELTDVLGKSIVEEAPTKIVDGGAIKAGFNAELDRLRDIMENGDSILRKIETREAEKTGIKNLKIGYTRVFGYYIEVTRSYYNLVPDSYTRKQTLTNCERFVTDELKQIESDILSAKDKALNLESEIFQEICEFVGSKLNEIIITAKAVADFDVLCSFAETAEKYDYVKPEISVDGIIDIKDGRHPVIENIIENETFVPNDTYLDSKATRMAIITGPNMSGKSTYMRQTALIVLMAQAGSFVPASYAKISVCDKIFTRIGAADDLSAGHSTFMVEMSEVADILSQATKNSLVIVDEVGRGTSTSDGLSIARAVAEHIVNPKKLGAKTLFATHYHELTDMDKIPGIKNLSVSARKIGDSIRFLRKIVPGAADESYGIEVAKLAGLPQSVIKMATENLKNFDNLNKRTDDRPLSLEHIRETEVINKLRRVNMDELNNKECREFLENIIESLKV